MNLRLMEDKLLNAKLELQQLIDPVTAIAAVKAGTEAADKVMDVVERGAKMAGEVLTAIDNATDKAADVDRIKGVLDFVKTEQITLV